MSGRNADPAKRGYTRVNFMVEAVEYFYWEHLRISAEFGSSLNHSGALCSGSFVISGREKLTLLAVDIRSKLIFIAILKVPGSCIVKAVR